MIEKGKIIAKNKRASFEYFLKDHFIAGMQLKGTEIKSIRDGKVNITDAFCTFSNGNLVVRNMHIDPYTHATHFNHEPKRDRILLLNKPELNKLKKKLQNTGTTLVPILLFISQEGWAKLEIALASGKKLHDKRDSIKDKEIKRQIDRLSNEY